MLHIGGYLTVNLDITVITAFSKRCYFFSEEECYHCMATLVAAKEKMFITQTKLLYEVTWKTVEQITKKHVVSKCNI